MGKFIRGTFELDSGVEDIVAYEEKHKDEIKQLFDWGDKHEISILVGTSEDNYYLCEYEIRGNTASYCKGMQSELKSVLKAAFPKLKFVWSGSGDTF